jgi:hypothetical protein
MSAMVAISSHVPMHQLTFGRCVGFCPDALDRPINASCSLHRNSAVSPSNPKAFEGAVSVLVPLQARSDLDCGVLHCALKTFNFYYTVHIKK